MGNEFRVRKFLEIVTENIQYITPRIFKNPFLIGASSMPRTMVCGSEGGVSICQSREGEYRQWGYRVALSYRN